MNISRDRRLLLALALNAAAAACIRADLQTGLVSHWKLDDCSGTTATDSAGSNDGTLTNGPTWTTGQMSGALDFNEADNEYVTVPNDATLQLTSALSITAWIKGDAWSSGYDVDVIVRKGESNPNNYQLAVADGQVTLYLDDSDGVGYRGDTVLNTGQWYHVAATWDGSEVCIYVDAILDHDPPYSKSGTIGTDTRAFYIGGRDGVDRFDGIIDDVRLYGRALSASEIASLMSERPLLLRYERTVTLDAATPSDDYQVQIGLGSGDIDHGKLQSQAEDLRFCDSSNDPLDYWIDNWSAADTSLIWTEVADSGTTSFIMRYGHSLSLPASEGASTFRLYDDFEDGVVGAAPTGWVVNSPASNVQVANNSGNKVLYDGDGGGAPVIATSSNWADCAVRHEFKIYQAAEPVNHAGLIVRYVDNSNMVYGGIITATTAEIWDRVGGTWTKIGGTWTITNIGTDWHLQELRIVGTSVQLYIDDALIGSGTLSAGAPTTGQTGFWSQYSSRRGYRDEHLVRAFSSTDPGATVGEETDNHTHSIEEKCANGTEVGDVVAYHPTPSEALSYAITAGNTGGAFAIDSDGTITVANRDALDFETNPTFSLTVEATDTNSLSDAATVTINVLDLADAVIIAESDGSTEVGEGCDTDSYTIVLDAEPSASVTITADPDAQTDLGSGAGVAINKIFTTSDWDTPQTVTVTAVDDLSIEGGHSSTITHSASSTDGDYDGMSVDGVTATIEDNEPYTITDLGSLDADPSYAYGLNSDADIAGFDEDTDDDESAWISDGSSLTSLGTLGGTTSQARDINDSDEVVGLSDTAGGVSHAFIWDSGSGMQDLGTVAGRSDSEAAAINDDGEVAGTVLNISSEPMGWLAFLYVPIAAHTLSAGMNSLGTLGGEASVATDVNDSGQVVGGAMNASDQMRPFLWEDGSMSDLGTLGGNNKEIIHRAEAVNSSGEVVGLSYTAAGDPHAFLWLPSAAYGLSAGMNDLGVLTGGDTSWALGINDDGYVVGMSTVTGGDTHAFLWADGTMHDLNDLIDGGSGWTLEWATDINADGEITGWGTNPSSDTRAFLLTQPCGMGGAFMSTGLSSDIDATAAAADNDSGGITPMAAMPCGTPVAIVALLGLMAMQARRSTSRRSASTKKST